MYINIKNKICYKKIIQIFASLRFSNTEKKCGRSNMQSETI